MFKTDFEALGGYDEDLDGYGWEDISLLIRAMDAGYTLMWWRGSDVDFTKRITTYKEKVSENMQNRNWKQTEQLNRNITLGKRACGELIVNKNRIWGYAPDLERPS